MSFPALVFDNPVLMRELRRRMRQRNTVILFLLYLGALCLIAWQTISYQTNAYNQQSMTPFYGSMYMPQGMRISSIGTAVFSAILFIQGLLVLILAPSVTSGMVKGEKEKETFDFLRATAITPLTYLLGALLSSVLLVSLSLLCAFPVLSIALLYGGVQEIIPSVLLLLSLSILLSSQGLMWSAGAEKLRTAGTHASGWGVGVGIFIFLFFAISGVRAARRLQSGHFLSTTVPPLDIPLWVVLCGVCLVISALCLLIAHRKFFDPSERALNPRQYGIVWALLLGIVAFFTAIPLTTSNPITYDGRLTFVTLWILVSSMGAFLAAPTFLLTRLRMGDERWHLRNRNPALRDRNDPLRHTLIVQALALIFVGAALGYVFHDDLFRAGFVLASLTVYLGILNLWTILLLRRTPYVSQAGSWCRYLTAATLLVPLVAMSFRTGRVASGFDGSDLFTCISPLGALILAVERNYSLTDLSIGVGLGLCIQVLALTILVILVRSGSDKHAVEVVAYDDGTTEGGLHPAARA